MARLPRLETYGEARNVRTVVQERERAPDTAVAEALDRAGSAVEQFGLKVAQAQTATETADADIALQRDLDSTYRVLSADGELAPEQLQARFREKSAEIIAQHAGRITLPGMRRVWQQRAQAITQDADAKVASLARQRTVERVRAQVFTTTAEATRMLSDPSVSLEAATAAAGSVRDLLRLQARSGVLAADDAARLELELDDQIRAGRETRVTLNLQALIDQGRIGEADAQYKAAYNDLSPRAREGIERVLQERGREETAVRMGDEIWREAGRDFGAALPLLERIADTQTRKDVEARVVRLREMEDAARAQQRDQDNDVAWRAFAVGGLRAIPSDVLGRLDGRTLVTLRNMQEEAAERARRASMLSAEERASIKAEEEAQSAVTAIQLMAAGRDPTMRRLYSLGPSAWALDPNAGALMDAYGTLTPDDRAKVYEDAAAARDGFGAASNVDKAFEAVIARAGLAGPHLAAKKSSYDDVGRAQAPAGGFTPEEIAVRGRILSEVQGLVARTGSAEVPESEMRAIIARAYAAVDAEQFPLPGDVPRRAPALAPGFMVTDAGLREDTRRTLRARLGREPTAQEITQAMRRVTGG